MPRRQPPSDREEREDLHGQIRRLRKIIKAQQVEINRLQKYQRIVTHISKDKTAKPPRIHTPKQGCEMCGSTNDGEANFNTRGGERRYYFCGDCGYRKKVTGE
jgi:transposase-like protein